MVDPTDQSQSKVPKMSNSSSAVHEKLIQLSASILDSLSRTPYTPPEGTNISIKSTLESLLPTQPSIPNPNDAESQLRNSIKDFALLCALLSASRSSTHDLLSWIPDHLCLSADSAFSELAGAYCVSAFGERNRRRVGELLPGVECGLLSEEKRLAVELMPGVLPLLKDRIKESCIDKDDKDGDEVSAASARTPVGFAIVAAYQFRWFVTQLGYPHLGKLCTLVIPAGLTALDHWSPEVKGQGMISFIHLAKNVNAAELGWYEEVILDACCQNIVSADEIWSLVVEMSVLLVTQIQRSNPRSPWFERILNEMLGHLERQRRDMDRHIPWLTFIEPLFHGVGLVLLSNFGRIFPLFFKWMHDGNDDIVLLVLKRIHLVMSLTWIRNTPYVERLVDELAMLYKEAAMKTARKEIRINVLEILVLLQQCKGLQFKAAWDKHKDDPNLATLSQSLCANGADDGSTHIKESQGNCLQWGSQPMTTP